MTEVEKIVVDLYGDWAHDPAVLPSLARLFQFMNHLYPDEMKIAFEAGKAKKVQTISRHE